MTALWITIAALAAAASLWLIWPMLRRDLTMSGESEYAMSVYRDQLDEIEKDHESGLIGDAERQAAEEEIERRALKMARQLDTSQMVGRRMPKSATVTFIVAIAGSVGLYTLYGAPTMPDRPLAARQGEILQAKAASGDVDSQVTLLAGQAERNPESLEAWWQLGEAHAATGNHGDAANAYRRAAELSGNDPGVLVTYAEAVTLANGNRVIPLARINFERVRKARPNDPRARYYLALAKAQAKDFEGALAAWLALKAMSTDDAPWMARLRRDIANMARFLKRDLKTIMPDATTAELAAAGQPAGEDDSNDLNERIAALERALEAEPGNWQGWIELVTALSHGGRNDDAAAALDKARKRYAAAPFILQKIDETAETLGLDHLAGGPDAEDVAAAAEMSDEDRADMINGMVEELAVRLENNPADPDGWIMLVRSYSVLNSPDKAAAALERAQTQFAGDATVLSRLDSTARQLGLSTK